MDDGRLQVEESGWLKQILLANERLLCKNEAGYAEFCYEAGIAYFYKYEDSNNKKCAGGYFEIAANSKYLEEAKRIRAERLYVISDYYRKIGQIDEAGDIAVTYLEYWKDLCCVTEGNIVEEDNERTAIVMYEEMVSQIIENAARFKNSGVSKEEITTWLVRIEEHLNNDFQYSEEIVLEMLQEEMLKLHEDIQSARRIVESVYKEIQ